MTYFLDKLLMWNINIYIMLYYIKSIIWEVLRIVNMEVKCFWFESSLRLFFLCLYPLLVKRIKSVMCQRPRRLCCAISSPKRGVVWAEPPRLCGMWQCGAAGGWLSLPVQMCLGVLAVHLFSAQALPRSAAVTNILFLLWEFHTRSPTIPCVQTAVFLSWSCTQTGLNSGGNIVLILDSSWGYIH